MNERDAFVTQCVNVYWTFICIYEQETSIVCKYMYMNKEKDLLLCTIYLLLTCDKVYSSVRVYRTTEN